MNPEEPEVRPRRRGVADPIYWDEDYEQTKAMTEAVERKSLSAKEAARRKAKRKAARKARRRNR